MTRRLERVKIAALASLPGLLREWLPNGEQRGDTYVALNPHRDDRTAESFKISMQTGEWRDWAIGVGGRDPISLYAYLFTDGDYRAAFEAVAKHPQVRAGVACGVNAPPAKTANLLKSSAAFVRSRYAMATVVRPGTAAAMYLQSRGLQQTTAWDRLRTHRLLYPGHGRHPALIAPIEALDGSLVGLHQTYLRPDGAKLAVSNPRRTLGQLSGCAVRLGQAVDRLIICEGLEDGLTLFQELDGHPVWVAGGSSFMAKVVIPETVRLLIIAADNDPPGKLAAQNAAEAHAIGGREVQIMRPSPGFKDFNDELRGIRHGE